MSLIFWLVFKDWHTVSSTRRNTVYRLKLLSWEFWPWKLKLKTKTLILCISFLFKKRLQMRISEAWRIYHLLWYNDNVNVPTIKYFWTLIIVADMILFLFQHGRRLSVRQRREHPAVRGRQVLRGRALRITLLSH